MKRNPLLLGLTVAGLLALGLAATTPALAQSDSGALVPPGDTPDLLMFHTGDVIGYLTPCG